MFTWKSCFIHVVDFFVNNSFPTFSASSFSLSSPSYLPPSLLYLHLLSFKPYCPQFQRKGLKKKSKEMCVAHISNRGVRTTTQGCITNWIWPWKENRKEYFQKKVWEVCYVGSSLIWWTKFFESTIEFGWHQKAISIRGMHTWDLIKHWSTKIRWIALEWKWN
jgi:hypothetical protein